jgi:glycosyltransferase involved in cell wall biosynthesis
MVHATEATLVQPVTSTDDAPELSVVLPCLNEELTVGTCIRKVQQFLDQNSIAGEIIVADNGSDDRSVQISEAAGARVVHVEERGYGSALRGGFEAAQGKYIVMADSDDSYDLANLMPFLDKLRAGYDLVIGNRFKGGIAPGAMPWHHRYVGNPVLSFVGRWFFHTPARDFHCGIRGLRKAAVERMKLRTTGMELASEIVIKASILEMRVCEVPTRLFPDGRQRRPHLRSFQDGWRHLRFLLVYSPRWLFAYPGLLLFTLGLVMSLVLSSGPIYLGSRLIDFHSLIVAGTMTVVGITMLSFSAITRVYSYNAGLLPKEPRFYSLFRYFNLERGLTVGSAVLLVGLLVIGDAIRLAPEFSLIGYNTSIRLVFGGCLATIVGSQVIFTSFVLSILGIRTS